MGALKDGVRLLAFVEQVRYDEATTLMTVDQANDVGDWLDGDGEEAFPESLRQVLGSCPVVESSPAKVFQTEASWGALLAIDGKGGEPTHYFLVGSDIASSPQVVQRTTAKVMAQAMILQSGVHQHGVQNFLG